MLLNLLEAISVLIYQEVVLYFAASRAYLIINRMSIVHETVKIIYGWITWFPPHGIGWKDCFPLSDRMSLESQASVAISESRILSQRTSVSLHAPRRNFTGQWDEGVACGRARRGIYLRNLGLKLSTTGAGAANLLRNNDSQGLGPLYIYGEINS